MKNFSHTMIWHCIHSRIVIMIFSLLVVVATSGYAQTVIFPFPPGQTWKINRGYNSTSHPDWKSCPCFKGTITCYNQLDGSSTDHFRNQLYALDLVPTNGSTSFDVHAPVSGTISVNGSTILIAIANSNYTLVLAHIDNPTVTSGTVTQGQVIGTDTQHIHMHIDDRRTGQGCGSDNANPYTPIAFTGTYAIQGNVLYDFPTGSSYKGSLVTSRDALAATVAPANTKICKIDGTTSGVLLTASATGGNGYYSYRWQKQNDAGTWDNVAVTASTYRTYTEGKFRCVVQSTNGNEVQRPEAKVKYYNDVTATAAPQSYTSCTPGTNFTFTATASEGSGTYTYQWQMRDPSTTTWNNIAGATARTYTTSTIGRFRCAVRSCGVTVNSNNVKIESAQAPTVVASGGGVVCPNASLTFSAAASGGGGAYNYQWYKQSGNTNVLITGATSSTYTTSAAGNYFCKVTSCNLSTNSNIVSLTNTNPVSISSHPFPEMTVCAGVTYTFSVSVQGGNGQYTYQWQVNVASIGWQDIGGANSRNYTATTPGSFRCRVSSCSNTVTSNIGKLLNFPSLYIVTQPRGGTACPGVNVVMNVVPGGGNGYYAYQWQRLISATWTNITGATGSSYSTGSTGVYRCSISGCAQTIYSNAVNVTYGSICPTQVTGDEEPVQAMDVTRFSGDQGFVLYPNPVKGIVTIELASPQEWIERVKLIDGMGNEIYRWTPENRTSTLSITIPSPLKATGYYLQVYSSQRVLTQRLIKE